MLCCRCGVASDEQDYFAPLSSTATSNASSAPLTVPPGEDEAAIAQFLSESGLPRHILAIIYELAVIEDDNFGYRTFCAACRLVAHVQSGVPAPLNRSLLAVLPKCPNLLRIKNANMDRVWEIWFYALAPEQATGKVPAEIAKRFFDYPFLPKLYRVGTELDRSQFITLCKAYQEQLDTSSCASNVGLTNSLESRLHVMEMRMLQEESSLQEKMEMGIGTSRKELLLYASLVKDYREAAAKLQTELTKLVVKKEALIQECFIAKEQVDRFRNIYTELLVKTENEKCEINYLTIQKAAYTADLNKLKQEVKKFVDDNAYLSSVSDKMDKEADSLSIKKTGLLDSVDIAKHDLQKLKEELLLLSNEYDSCKRERDDQVSNMLLHIQNIQLKEKGRMNDMGEILNGIDTLSAISATKCDLRRRKCEYDKADAASRQCDVPDASSRQCGAAPAPTTASGNLRRDHRGVPTVKKTQARPAGGRPEGWETFEAVQHSSF